VKIRGRCRNTNFDRKKNGLLGQLKRRWVGFRWNILRSGHNWEKLHHPMLLHLQTLLTEIPVSLEAPVK
jgi:hypothetical protein